MLAYNATMLLGAHLSIAGGLHRAVESAADYGFETVALFVRNQRQWSAPPLEDAQVEQFRSTRQATGIGPIVAHGSYLVNLAGAGRVRERSLAAVAEDLDRCGRLGIEYLVLHPGSAEDTDAGIARIAEGLDAVLPTDRTSKTTVLLETTAGQGNSIGHRFEHLAAILTRCSHANRLGVCLDTAHVFAAGYDLRTADAGRAMLREFDEVIGLGRLQAVHLNDSLKPIGSRVDRHAHIGQGHIGREGFGWLVRSRKLPRVPMILETPKGADASGRDWDRVNSDLLRRLSRRRGD
jgi:deoxyribonuclease IV